MSFFLIFQIMMSLQSDPITDAMNDMDANTKDQQALGQQTRSFDQAN